MADNNFDLKGFLSDPKIQADKPAAIKYLQSKGIIDQAGNVVGNVKGTQESNQSFFSKVGGFASDVFKGMTAPIAKSLVRGGEAVQDVAQIGAKTLQTGSLNKGLTETKTPEWNLPYYGKIGAPTGTGDILGTAAQTVSLGLGPVAGGAAYMGGQAAAENKGLIGTAVATAEGAALGKFGEIGAKVSGEGLASAGGFLKEIGSGSKVLTSLAEEQYAKVLAPTTKGMKQTTQQIIGGLAKRKGIYFSRKGLLSDAEKQVSKYSQQLEDAWEKLPEGHQTEVKPIIESITKAQDNLYVKGAKGNVLPEGNADIANKLGELKKELISIAGDENAPTRVLREYRQALDKIVNKAGKGFGLSLNDSAVLSARKTVVNSIREQLAKANPEIGKINNDFTFWKRIQDVIGSTVERKTGQGTPFPQQAAKIAGAAVGFSHGGWLGALEGGVIMKNIQKLADSTAWNTFSAASKSKLADALASGEGNVIADALEGMAKVAGVTLEKTGKFIGGIPKAARELPKKNIPGTPELNLKEKIKGLPAGMSTKADVEAMDYTKEVVHKGLEKLNKTTKPMQLTIGDQEIIDSTMKAIEDGTQTTEQIRNAMEMLKYHGIDVGYPVDMTGASLPGKTK